MTKTRKNMSEEEKKAKRREQVKLCMRRKREKLKRDPEGLEEVRRKDRERYYKKKEKGLIKTIKDHTPRQQRKIRKYWKENSQKYRTKRAMQKKVEVMLTEDTPPSSPASSQIRVRRNVATKNRRILYLENKILKNKLNQLENVISKYKMRFTRLKKRSPQQTRRVEQLNHKRFVEAKIAIQDFLEQDEHSRLTSGKKETITRKKQKKQIRLLNDTMLNLYKQFKEKTKIKISYCFFCKYRPFWVIFPTVKNRDTCLCATHANIDFLVKSVFKTQMITENTSLQLIRSITCEGNLSGTCLERICKDCVHRNVTFNNFNGNDKITYERWVTKKVNVIIKGQDKLCQKTIKETVITDKKTIAAHLQSQLLIFMRHIRNIYQQQKIMRQLKSDLNKTEAILHLDFSENYGCKYAAEVQSTHFGGSKPQISLHTSVLYYQDQSSGKLIVKSYCTISDNLRHDPVMICVHLKPVLDEIKINVPYLNKMHFLSDGPTTQYRNKTMFQLIAKYLSSELNADAILWHYSESGHGKGAPDGVGGYLKRTADRRVALGDDIPDFQSLVTCLQKNCPSIKVIPVGDQSIGLVEDILKDSVIKPFKGTMKVHQITWAKEKPNVLQFRRLSCLECSPNITCVHFNLGKIVITDTFISSNTENEPPVPSCSKLTVDDIYSDSSDEIFRPMQQNRINILPTKPANKIWSFYNDSSSDSDKIFN